ncbi:unnamed protein product [Calypogeia fissa]
MELARLFSSDDKLDGARNFINWHICVRTLLERDDVWDELSFEPNADAVDDAGDAGVAGEVAEVEVLGGDVNAPAPPRPQQPPGQRGAQPQARRQQQRTPEQIQKLRIKARSIFAATVKDKFLPTVNRFADDLVGFWNHLKQRFGGDLLQ